MKNITYITKNTTTMNYCSHCGSSNIQNIVPEGDTHLRHTCADCGLVHYQNPKIIVGCLVFYGEKLMLCKRQIEPRAGMWNLPAGFMENGETVEHGAMREVREEANAEVEIERLFAIYNVVHAHQVYIVFLARLKEPIFSAGDETSDVQLFDLQDIPFDQLAFNSNVFAIRSYMDNPDYKGVFFGDSRNMKR